MLILLGALIVAAAIVWAAARASRSGAPEPARAPGALTELLALFAPAATAVREDPRALLTWQPLAVTARRLFPKECALLDQASGGTFPFTADQMQDAHARWTTDWLTWERNHDAACKLKTATVAHELGDAATSAYGRARLDAVDREKLDQYQRRYEEYTRIARALQALTK